MLLRSVQGILYQSYIRTLGIPTLLRKFLGSKFIVPLRVTLTPALCTPVIPLLFQELILVSRLQPGPWVFIATVVPSGHSGYLGIIR